MGYTNLTYIIVTAEKAISLDYSEFLNRDSNSLRYSADKSKAIVKYKEEKSTSIFSNFFPIKLVKIMQRQLNTT